jgi:Skp family chaperone for outer membrane proteins
MKKIALIAALAATAVASADIKIGTVDMIMLVRNHSSYEPNKKLLNDTEKDYAKKVDRMKADLEEIQEEGKSLSEQLRNPMLAPAAKAKLEKDLLDIQNKFLSGQQAIRNEMMRSQQDMQGLEGRLLKATTEDLHKRIDDFAEKAGYDLILDVSAAPFAKKSLDVTPDILKAMGVDPATAKGSKDFDNEGK